jgi:hypothetical protein
MTDSWKDNDTSDELHVTFMFHCAFVRTEGARRTDVILAPGFTPSHDEPQVATESGGDGTAQEHAGHDPDDQHSSANGHSHPMQHIASLRIPALCVADNSTHKDYVTQETTTFTETGVNVEEDRIWRLEGWDVSIQPDGLGAAPPASTPANFQMATTDGDKTYTLANISTLSGRKIDPRFKSDNDVPELLHRGSRVRVWGGTLSCHVPGGLLRHRTWNVGLENPVGLSDRVDYRRSIPVGAGATIVFKKFGTDETKTVTLKPRNGVIRIHVTNDPFVEDTPHGSREKNPCETLPHFPSYGVLLEPAGTVTNLGVPPVAETDTPQLVTISEGNTYCCPCSDGVP